MEVGGKEENELFLCHLALNMESKKETIDHPWTISEDSYTEAEFGKRTIEFSTDKLSHK